MGEGTATLVGLGIALLIASAISIGKASEKLDSYYLWRSCNKKEVEDGNQ